MKARWVVLAVATIGLTGSAASADPPLGTFTSGTPLDPTQGATFDVETTCDHITITFHDLGPDAVAYAAVDHGPLQPLSPGMNQATFPGWHDSYEASIVDSDFADSDIGSSYGVNATTCATTLPADSVLTCQDTDADCTTTSG